MPDEIKPPSGWPVAAKAFLVIFSIFIAYAFIRYNILKGVELIHLPLYVNNKALALTATALIGLSYLMGPLARFWPKIFVPKVHYRKYFGILGFGIAALHGLISLLLFSPANYPKFFLESGKLSMIGELSMLFGVLALFLFAIPAITSLHEIMQSLGGERWLLSQRIGYIAYVLVLFHVFFMGRESWLNAAGWPKGMLPMSLVAFIIIAVVLLFRLLVIVLPQAKKTDVVQV